MPYLSLIPPVLRSLEQRVPFLDWLRSMPITFHQRLRIYFSWLDLHTASYTQQDIDSLNIKDKIVDQPPLD